VVECDEGSKVESGERLGGVCCGMVVSKISDRRSVENVRFASSAGEMLANCPASVRSLMSILLWKWSSPWGVRFFCFEGVAGEPSSWSKLKLACRSWPSRLGMNLLESAMDW
jgi:hypothetical protein